MDTQDLSGKTLGQYQLEALLGAGGMGAVYRAHQINLNRAVAIKVLPSGLGANPDFALRFRREAQTVAALQHPHIIPIHDYGSEGNLTYIVMPLLTGGTLADRLKAGAHFSLPAVVDLLKKLASALDHAHYSGVIHRDLKPANIMFDAHNTPFLVDFGIAKILSGTETLVTQQGVTVGTPPYMAPEQWRGEQLSPATDQYALAIVIYQTLTEQLPFVGDTTHAFMYQHLEKEPEMPHVVRRDLPKEISEVLLRALAKPPQARYPTITALAQDFERAATGLKPARATTVKLTTPTSTSVAPKPLYQQPIAWVSLVVLLGVIALLIVLLINNQGGSTDITVSATVEANVGDVVGETPTEMLIDAPAFTPSPTQTPSLTFTSEPIDDNGAIATETSVARASQVAVAVAATLTAQATQATIAVTFDDTILITRTAIAGHTQTASAIEATQTAINPTPTLSTPTPQLSSGDIIATHHARRTAIANNPTDNFEATPTQALETPRFSSGGIIATHHARQTQAAIGSNTAVETTPVQATVTPQLSSGGIIATHHARQTMGVGSSEASPTLEPTLTPSMEPTLTLTPTQEPTHTPTLTPSATFTASPTTTIQPTPTLTLTASPTPQGDPLMAFTSDRDGNAEIYVVYQSGREQRLTQHSAVDRSPTWSPDGRQIAFASDRDGVFFIFLMNPDGTNVRRLTKRTNAEAAPAWSPNGEWIAYHSNVNDNWDIYMTNVNTGVTLGLTQTNGDDLSPTWSPDSGYIMFMSFRDNDWELYMVDVETYQYRRMTSFVAEHMFPSWGPVGNLIAFMSDRDGNREIYIVLLEMGIDVAHSRFSVIRRVTTDPAEDTTPQWSPNGIDIAFVSRRDSGTQDIYLTNSAGSDLRRLTSDSGNNYDPAWYPYQP